MRDAFGGTFMIQILLVFIVIYVGFIGIAINYGRAFRIKNYIIDFLEEYQVEELNQTSGGQNLVEAGVGEILSNVNYKYSDVCNKYYTPSSNSKCIDGVIIYQNEKIEKNGVTHVYYTVNTYFGFNLGFLNSLLSLSSSSADGGRLGLGYFVISGQTKVIVSS